MAAIALWLSFCAARWASSIAAWISSSADTWGTELGVGTMVGVPSVLSCASGVAVSMSGWSSSSSSFESSSYTPNQCAPGLELVRGARGVVFVSREPALVLCVSGAASGVVVTGVEVLASIDVEDRGLF